MVVGRDNLRVDEDVCVDGLYASAAVNQVKELVSIEQIHTGLLDCLPAAERELCVGLWPLLGESLPEKLVGQILKCPPLPYGLLPSFVSAGHRQLRALCGPCIRVYWPRIKMSTTEGAAHFSLHPHDRPLVKQAAFIADDAAARKPAATFARDHHSDNRSILRNEETSRRCDRLDGLQERVEWD